MSAVGSRMSGEKCVVLRQVRSQSGRTKEVVRTMQALGLRRIGDSRRVAVNPATAGMIKRVHQLVVVDSAE